MDNIEAIKNLNAMKMNYDQRDKKSIPIQTIELAIEALKKQIPMKPNGNKCLICGSDVEIEVMGISVMDLEYCNDCGQKIDWSEQDD